MDLVITSVLHCFEPLNLLILCVGTLVGLFVGTLPGLGAAIGVALMLPFTYELPTVTAILLLIAVYQGAEYGGSISAITLGIPGTPAAVATVLDGNPMARKGFPAKAIGYSLTASTIGGLAGGIALIAFSAPLANAAVKLGAPEYALIGLLGLAAVVALSSKDVVRSALSVFLGLLLTVVGIDSLTGVPRFTFGRMELLEGLPLVPILIGLFAISEVIQMITDGVHKRYVGQSIGFKMDLALKDILKVKRPITIGSLIGVVTGIIPGLGAGPASWFSYSLAKKTSKSPELFGSGHSEGIAAPEAANNATVGGALIPLLGLGIPGSPTTGIILGAFIIHGIQPGPQIFGKTPELVYGLFAGFILAVMIMYFLGRLTTPIWSRALAVPNYVLIIIILAFSIVGSYTDRNLLFDVYLTLVVGIMAFFMKKLDFSLASLILGFILGEMIETNLRRSLMLSDGSLSIFITRPASAVLTILILTMIGLSIRNIVKQKKQKS
ncbi:MAG: tripartite tricarboxylate transporter permease [Dehalobacterium sp.]